jgi:hypothetical protein
MKTKIKQIIITDDGKTFRFESNFTVAETLGYLERAKWLVLQKDHDQTKNPAHVR